MDKKVLIFIADKDFRDEEYEIPYNIFVKEGLQVDTASTTLEKITGKLGMEVKPDVLINKIDSKDYDAFVIVGGPGIKKYWDDKVLHDKAGQFLNQNKLLTAICSAPVVLAHAGLLKNKKATSFSGDEKEMINHGVNFTGQPVEIDGNIITGNGPKSADLFAVSIVENLR